MNADFIPGNSKTPRICLQIERHFGRWAVSKLRMHCGRGPQRELPDD